MRDQAAILPGKVRVSFSSVRADDQPLDASSPSPYYDVDVSLDDVASDVVGLAEGTEGVPGFKKLYRSTAVALFDATHTADPSNRTALTALAKKVAADFWSWRCLSYDVSAAGPCSWAQDGVADVEWTYRGGECRTRACGWPMGDEPEELHQVDRFDPTLPGAFYHAKTGGSGIGAASSATQMTGGTVTVYKEDFAGALTVLNGPDGNPVTVKAWNKATGGSIPANTHVGITKDSPTGKWIVTWIQC